MGMWDTTSKVAVPLKVSTSMAAAIIGVRVLKEILNMVVISIDVSTRFL